MFRTVSVCPKTGLAYPARGFLKRQWEEHRLRRQVKYPSPPVPSWTSCPPFEPIPPAVKWAAPSAELFQIRDENAGHRAWHAVTR